MKNACFSVTVAVMICISAAFSDSASAATDNIYTLTEISPAPAWDGASTSLLQGNAIYGDESVITYSLPWTFRFYGQSFTSINADTNGNIWFGSAGPAHNFNLSTNTSHVPVIAAWNDDLSSAFYGGVFIQHKSDPDRVVVEWRTETYTDEGLFVPNSFEAILFANGRVRIDYRSITTVFGNDSGSGISRGDGVYYDITSNIAPVYTLAAAGQRSFQYSVPMKNLQLNFAGTGGGSIAINPYGLLFSTNYIEAFPITDTLTLHPAANEYSTFTGWTAGACSGTGDCTIAMTSDASTTASFSLNTDNSTRIDRGGNTYYYQSIQAAYNASSDNDTIKLWAVTYSEDLNCNLPYTITLQGGYNVGYTAINGEIVMNGSLTIGNGAIISDGLAIK
jgi:hypothetical protein